ncbi:MAG: uroporphyrinogen-III synthase [Terriglobales bacterium]
MPNVGFNNIRVLSLESRRSKEIAQLIINNGGRPTVAPSTREVPDSNPEELNFAASLLQDQFAAVIFMTGVGTRALVQAVEPVCSRAQFAAALGRTNVVARGPKPIAALRELGVPVTLAVPEPNTWREILQVLDQNPDKVPLRGKRIAVQEHGVPSPELYAGLRDRGAEVIPVHVYQWSLPEDVTPLREAIFAIARNEIDAALFTSSVQIVHLFQIAEELKLRDDLVRNLNRAMIASIGPVTSETLREYGITVDLEPTHPKMGILVKEAAEQSERLLREKRAGAC